MISNLINARHILIGFGWQSYIVSEKHQVMLDSIQGQLKGSLDKCYVNPNFIQDTSHLLTSQPEIGIKGINK